MTAGKALRELVSAIKRKCGPDVQIVLCTPAPTCSVCHGGGLVRRWESGAFIGGPCKHCYELGKCRCRKCVAAATGREG